jgi:hypothetical protein
MRLRFATGHSILSLQDQGSLLISGGSLSVAATSFIDGSLTMTGGTLSGTGTTTISGDSLLTGGTIGGTTNFTGALSISGDATKAFAAGTINTSGTTTWGGNTTAGGNTIQFYNATVNNTGTWLDQNANSAAATAVCCASVFTFNNSGTYQKTGAGVTSFNSVAFNNTGLLEVDAGELILSKLTETDGLPNLDLALNSQVNNVLDITTSATLYGIITLDFDFKPTAGEVITVFDYGNHTGTFSSIVGAGDAAGLTFTPIYNGTDFQVEVGPPAFCGWGRLAEPATACVERSQPLGLTGRSTASTKPASSTPWEPSTRSRVTAITSPPVPRASTISSTAFPTSSRMPARVAFWGVLYRALIPTWNSRLESLIGRTNISSST